MSSSDNRLEVGQGSNEETEIERKSLSHGVVSVRGRRRDMEDKVKITVIKEANRYFYDFFGIYDGHAGSSVAESCGEWMHQLIAEEMESGTHGGGRAEGEVDYWEKVMDASFSRMHSKVMAEVQDIRVANLSAKTGGSTAVVVMVDENVIVVSNCGDSRAVLSHGGVTMPLSNDHKLDRPDELERLEAAGAIITPGDRPRRNSPRVMGILSISRSIGDYYQKPYVISKPEVTVTNRTEDDEFLVIASDGLWDVLSSEAVCDVVRGHLRNRTRTRSPQDFLAAACLLAQLALARFSKDNISIILIDLKK